MKMPEAFWDGTVAPFPMHAPLHKLLGHFRHTWAAMLEWDASQFGEIPLRVEVAGCVVDAISQVERGRSVANCRKGMHRPKASAGLMDDIMNVVMHGPDLKVWDPLPAADSWYYTDKRGWQ